MIALYRLASAYASGGRTERARALFETVVDRATGTDSELTGKAWFKLATLDVAPDEALRCCEQALQHLPSHRAARQLRDALKGETIHG